jgi:glyoxylase-like metal-dependent hydrolase (beta-lactamase superfamily II)
MKQLSFILLLFCTLGLIAQGNFDEVVVKDYQLADHIYMLEGAGGNVGVLIRENGDAVMIDDQYAPMADKLKTKIKELGGKRIVTLVNTHWHGDHTGSNEIMGNDGVLIVAHENVRERMGNEQPRGDRVTPPSPDIALPVITFNDGINLYQYDEPIMVIHVHHAHTDGDALVWFPQSNVLHMGDVFFHKRFPYIDLDSGGSVDGVITATETALMLVDEATKIIPGHGPHATKQDLEDNLKFLKITREKMSRALAANQEVEKIDANDLVKGYEEWAWGFIDAERLKSIFFSSMTLAH